jgi:endonuclease YncB( thermonuclease family)
VAALLLVSTLAAGTMPALAAAGTCLLSPTETVAAIGAIDGETIALEGGGVLRLAGIEAAGSPGFGDDAQAAAARAALDARIAGQTLSLVPVGPETDRYGRRHAQAFLSDGTWLQEALIGPGWARVHPREGETACAERLLEVENQARAAGRGVWSDKRSGPRNADDPSLSERSGLYEVVEGRVLSVGHGSYMVFLDFGRNYRRDFTAMVPAPVAERLAIAGIAVDSLKGRHIRVRGVIEESGGPAIRITDPVVLEVLDGG